MTRPTLFGERFLPPEPEGPAGPDDLIDETGKPIGLIGTMGLALAACGALVLIGSGMTMTRTHGATRSASLRRERQHAEMRAAVREARGLGNDQPEESDDREDSEDDQAPGGGTDAE